MQSLNTLVNHRLSGVGLMKDNINSKTIELIGEKGSGVVDVERGANLFVVGVKNSNNKQGGGLVARLSSDRKQRIVATNGYWMFIDPDDVDRYTRRNRIMNAYFISHFMKQLRENNYLGQNEVYGYKVITKMNLETLPSSSYVFSLKTETQNQHIFK